MKLRNLIFLVLIASAIASAQDISAPTPQPGTIIGTVVDTTGGVIPGAKVVLQGPTANDQRTVTSRDNGFFELKDVTPGITYSVTISAEGFGTWRSDEITLTPSQTAILSNIKMRVATVETVTDVVPQEVIAVQQERTLENQRLIGFIPNVYVSYEQDAVPLSSKLKFRLAVKALTNPVTIAGFTMNSAMYQAAGYPAYQQGMKGYGQRLGATFAGGWTKIMVGDAILPSLLHQDPRYFYQGTGTTGSRLKHALASAFITRTDDGRRAINFSNLGGDLVSGAMANAYYPDRDRGAGLVMKSSLIGIGGRMVNAVAQEFLFHKWTKSTR